MKINHNDDVFSLLRLRRSVTAAQARPLKRTPSSSSPGTPPSWGWSLASRCVLRLFLTILPLAALLSGIWGRLWLSVSSRYHLRVSDLTVWWDLVSDRPRRDLPNTMHHETTFLGCLCQKEDLITPEKEPKLLLLPNCKVLVFLSWDSCGSLDI